MAYQDGSSKYDVPYSIKNESLEFIFQHELHSNNILYNITGGVETDGEISEVDYNDIITFTSSGVFEVTHNNYNRPINFLLVGPGGDGSKSSWGTTLGGKFGSTNIYKGYGGNGGGGGEVIDSSFIPVSGTYNISMGSSAVTKITGLSNVIISQARPGYDGVSTQYEEYNGESGSGNSQASDFQWTGGGKPPLVPGLGGGGDSEDGLFGYVGGAGTVFNKITYGSGGFGGGSSWNDGAAGAADTGAGGQGGGYKNKTAPTGGYGGGSGGSGICILYFNPIEI